MQAVAHGIDLVEVARIARLLEEHGESFIERCFSPGERQYCEQGGGRRAERYAARFAAKEAVFKALGTGWSEGVGWRDVEVVREPSGRPRIAMQGRGRDRAASLGIRDWLVSLSHTDAVACASVIGCG